MLLAVTSLTEALSLADLERCYSDQALWTDFDLDPKADRPFGNAPVWIGYDPSRTRDDATCVVVAPPLEQGGKFRILEKHSWRGHSFTYQAGQVKKLCDRFNVQHIGIDVTGVGYGVFDLVRDFFPRATPIHYSLETKNTLVLKAQDTIQARRIEWDAGWNDIAAAFLTIKRGATTSGQITYSASRTDATGHADIAWAVMHALAHEPLNVHKKRRSRWSTLEGSHERSQATGHPHAPQGQHVQLRRARGFIFYTNDPNLSEADEERMQAQIGASKGVGNFRSLFVNIPGGGDKAIQIIPVGDIATKDEFERIKNITRNDVIAAWRMNPALAGCMPENAAGFGDVEKIDRVYMNNEIRPIRQLFLQVNLHLRKDRVISWAHHGL